MAIEQPDAVELLGVAREVLLGEVLPALPRAQRYNALMLANVLAIAGRECAAGADPERAEALARDEFLRARGSTETGSRDLAGSIRRGELDQRDPELRRLLLDQTLRRLRLSNPKYLKSLNLE